MSAIDAYLEELLGSGPTPAAVAAASVFSHEQPTASRESVETISLARAHPSLEALMPSAPIASIPRVPPAAPGRARTATGGNRWLRVCVGRDSYAFELLRVQEVVRVAPVVAMRGAAHSVLGVMNLRGRIVPVFDLGLWLDVGGVTVDERARVVVVERDDELIGVLVTCVEDVVSLEREHVEPPLQGTDPGPTLGVARVTDAPTVLLDAGALFA
ncbi:chemotaxis protein CheW [Cognatilysobacter lacus]|uniref:Chemotaxis protein CheW n=1 Tax=Cognatilysobacter lacus TaxID=1643323 RepID=A0A5D8Z111_9GAMM|nr:chemotaxis protein CheW [Lysobacter lacus]TZF88409.1 purine-binding chemotaxis protein CheW [Lysobacter lacus]